MERRTALRSLAVIALAVVWLGAAYAQPAPKAGLIVSKEPFSPNGRIGPGDSEEEQLKVEEGELNGVKYRIYYSDGSGIFVGTRGNSGTYGEPFDLNWDVGCKKDPISDDKHCYMHMKDLWVFSFSGGVFIVKIGSGHFPGSTVTIRIDKGKPITALANDHGAFSVQTSKNLIARLKRASQVTTRHMKWPYRSWVDETWELYGFNEALQYIAWAVKKVR